jgi:hypothetical protein
MAVAAALQDWGLDHGATCTAHWFQPLGSNQVRPGMSGMVINHFFTFNPTKGNIELKYDGETLVKGETDGSSYPNGGLRATHTAGGYVCTCVRETERELERVRMQLDRLAGCELLRAEMAKLRHQHTQRETHTQDLYGRMVDSEREGGEGR